MDFPDFKQGPESAIQNQKALEGSKESDSDEKHVPTSRTDAKDGNSDHHTFQNRPYDEEFELSKSDSDSSIETDDGKGSLTKGPSSSSSSSSSKTSPLLSSPTLLTGEQKDGMRQDGGPTRVSSGLENIADSRFSLHQTQNLDQTHTTTHDTEPESSDDDEDDDDDEDEDEDEDEDDSDDDSSKGSKKVIPGSYNPRDYDYLNVSSDIKELFQHIERFQFQDVELDTVLQCFIPDYIPTVGEMFNSLTVPPLPSLKLEGGKEDEEEGKGGDHTRKGKAGSTAEHSTMGEDLGLRMLAEPSTKQSDPTVLELQLRALSKKSHGDVMVRSIEDAQNNPKAIEQWIENVEELHRTKPQTQVHYHFPMPEIETLMDVWPEEVEEVLSKIQLPNTAELDVSLTEQLDLICAFLDIPIHENRRVESLHLLFNLFLEFKNNPHFGGSDEYKVPSA